jgi:ubiquitin C-terminal hydrolase
MNLNNQCFIFFNLNELINELDIDLFRDLVNLKNSEIKEEINGSLLKNFSEIIETIYTKGSSVIEPITLKKIINTKIKSFNGFLQQDAHECLIQILDCFIEETGIESEPEINNVPENIYACINHINDIKKKILEIRNNNEELKLEINKLNKFKEQNKDLLNKYNGLNYMISVYKKRYNPFIFQSKIFLINYITCKNCSDTNCNYENNTVLSLEICDNLLNSLDLLVKEEELNDYTCEVCLSKQKTSKICKIWHSPLLLFIQLKRFKQLPNGFIQKDKSIINIPEYLDISPYFDSSIKNNIKNEINFNKYRLKGISNHHGSLNNGHYTADCLSIKNNNSWYHFDDDQVYRMKNMDTSSAYILMYEII